MLILPGIFYFILLIIWLIFNFIPSYSLKLMTLIESIGYTGTVITIFISNTRVRHQFFNKRKLLKRKKKLKKIQRENYGLILLNPPITRKLTTIQSSYTIENIPVNSNK